LKFSARMLTSFALLLCFFLPRAAKGESYFPVPPSMAENAGLNLYVAEDGDDTQSGAFETPLKTLRAALIQALRPGITGPVTIWMRGGTYLIDQTLAAVGTPPFSQLTIRAYGTERPVLTGGKALSGWTETTLNGVTVWTVPYAGGELRALYGEDGARQPSRLPKQGFFRVLEPYSKTESKLEGSYAFYVNKSDMPPTLEGAVVRLLHWWKDELTGVKGYVSASGLLLLNRYTSMTVAKGDLFWLENVPNVPLAPGEWLFDQQNQRLYYAPLPNEAPGVTRLYAGVEEQLIALRGLSNVEFHGITFARTGWNIPKNDAQPDFPQAAYDVGSAIFVAEGENIRFINCTFQSIGSACIRLDFAVKNAVISGCTFENIGAQAVYVRGQNESMEPVITEGIVIENNHINGYGQNFLNAAAILIIHSRGAIVSHNEIHGGTYTAISAGWVWGTGYSVTESIRIQNNLIYGIGQGRLSDMGAIYLLGSQPNTVVSGNIIHDVISAEYGGWGIYLDEGSDGIRVTNNLVYRCSAQGFHQHSGVYNTVENNIFAFNQDGQIGASGPGAFYLNKNIIVGEKPYFKQEKESEIRQGKNIFRTEGSLFFDAEGGNFNLVNDPGIAAIGFTPWIFFAGRYASIHTNGGED